MPGGERSIRTGPPQVDASDPVMVVIDKKAELS
jgi:hypothetical protein